MKQQSYKYLELVLEELERRLPKTNKDGFLASDELYEAINDLNSVVFLQRKKQQKSK